jgi:GNAT superfamily N-acetyltransferase
MPVIRTTDAEEAARLRAMGAGLLRHAHDMALDLAVVQPPPGWSRPELPDGLRLAGVAGSAPGVAAASLLAYAAGHPDLAGLPPPSRREAEMQYEVMLAGGGSAGPVIEPASAIVTDAAGDVLASIVVTRLEPRLWWAGGPWVADLFVVPAHQGRGLGRALLQRAVAWCGTTGEPRIGLTVTVGNPAEHLYAAVGFQRRRTLFVLDSH